MNDCTTLENIDFTPLIEAFEKLKETLIEFVRKIAEEVSKCFAELMKSIYGDNYCMAYEPVSWKTRIRQWAIKILNAPKRFCWRIFKRNRE